MTEYFKLFGGKLTKERIKKYQQSPYFRDGSFRNMSPASTNPSPSSLPRIIYKQFFAQQANRVPPYDLPIQPFDKDRFLSSHSNAQMIWYGHSVILMRMSAKTILIDPMLGPDTTPISPLATKRFSTGTLSLIDEFPPIDLVVITHDHYDHLDYASIQKLKDKTQSYFVALGVKRHLVDWGIEAERITEFEWWDQKKFGDLMISFTPTQHFSGRSLRDRNMTLWGGWAFKNTNENIWFSGDGGYGNHFKEIGKQLGPFDFAFMECGQYNEDWPNVHLFPKESVQAAKEAGVKKAMPIHWGGFNLSYYHTWSQPPTDFIQHALEKNVAFCVPPLGEQFDRHSTLRTPWWDDKGGHF